VSDIDSFSSDSSSLSASSNLLFIVNRNLSVTERLEALVRLSRNSVVRLLDIKRNLSLSVDSVRELLERSSESIMCELIVYFLFLFLMSHLVEFPEASKALLSTEESRF
jgi:hypothetical protein